jgi:hypothetical protein
MGWSNNSMITNCYATGIVNGYEDSEYIGGLVGNNSSSVITNCYATGDVSGNEHVGGLLGLNVYGSVINCYAVGNVIGIGSSIGGLVGTNSVNSTITNCYFDILTTGQANGIGFNTGGTVSVAGKNTEEMKQQSTFEDWDFEDIWTICTFGNNGYPYLQWQDIDCTPNSIETIINDELQIMVYPNPVKDELRIESGEVKIINIKIIDLTGKTYVNCQLLTNSIDVSFLSSGIYFVKLETEKGSVTKKIIKE